MDKLANNIGCLHSEMECSHVINLAMDGTLKRLTRRLTEKEKRMIKPGYAFIYLEEESGIIRWTDSKSWTPSRALGPFMMYIEKRSDNPLIKKIYTAKVVDKVVHIVIYNVYNHEERGICCEIYSKIRNLIIPESYSKMARTHLNDKKKRNHTVKNFIHDNHTAHFYNKNSMRERYTKLMDDQYNNTRYKGLYNDKILDQYINHREEFDLSFDNLLPLNLSLSQDRITYKSIDNVHMKRNETNEDSDDNDFM